MSKNTRRRQLQKLAERRAAERRRQRRRRIIAGSLVGALVLGAGGATALTLLRGGGDPTGGESPTPGPTTSPATVACGGEVPAAAGQPKPTFDAPPEMDVDRSASYVAVIDTSCGRIAAELFPEEAPRNVNSFVFLAREGFFDGLTFHRLEPGFVVQGGDPTGTGSGGPGYALPDELDNDLQYEQGTLAMANSGPDTAGSQFFIVTGEQGAGLPKQYTIFGRVTDGLRVLERMDTLPVEPNPDGQTHHPVQTIYIERVTIRER